MREYMYVSIESVIERDLESLEKTEDHIAELLKSPECKRDFKKTSGLHSSVCNDCKYSFSQNRFEKRCALLESLSHIVKSKESLQEIIDGNNRMKWIDDRVVPECHSSYTFKEER